jgi:hypothetical protein
MEMQNIDTEAAYRAAPRRKVKMQSPVSAPHMPPAKKRESSVAKRGHLTKGPGPGSEANRAVKKAMYARNHAPKAALTAAIQ